MSHYLEAIIKKYIACIFVLAFTFVFSSTLFAAVPRDQQAKLWSDLVEAKVNPTASKLDKWNVIENIELIKKVDKVSAKAVVLATIINYYDKKEEIFFGKNVTNKTMENWSSNKKALKEDADKNGEKFQKHFNKLDSESPLSKKRFFARHKDSLTNGIDMSYMLEENYLQKNGNDIVLAATDFADKRGLAVDVTIRNDLRFDELADFIEKQNPVILQTAASENYLIFVGYIRRGTEEYLITADPNKVMIEEYSEAAEIKVVDGHGEKYKKYLESVERKEGLAKRDMEIKIANGLQRGVEITDWKSGKYTAYVIRDFKLTEAGFEKFLKFIKEKYK